MTNALLKCLGKTLRSS